jgi:transcriptional regulator with XRE-family HTH domain
VAQVLGDNVRRLRGDHRSDDLARAMGALGFDWTPATVTYLERGDTAPRLETLMGLAAAFGALLGRPVTLAELFAGSGNVDVGGWPVELAAVRAALSGDQVTLRPQSVSTVDLLMADFREHRLPAMLAALVEQSPGRAVLLWEVWRACGEAERRTAHALGIDLYQLTDLMADRWGHTLTTERDKRGGPDASAQRRGQITRQLRQELQEALTDGDD